jgi:hypothetical protein
MKATLLSRELLFRNYHKFIVFGPKYKISGLPMSQSKLQVLKDGGVEIRKDMLVGKKWES